MDNFMHSCRLDLNKYHCKYQKAVTIVENNPQSADKNNKEFYFTVKEQCAAVQKSFQKEHPPRQKKTWKR